MKRYISLRTLAAVTAGVPAAVAPQNDAQTTAPASGPRLISCANDSDASPTACAKHDAD